MTYEDSAYSEEEITEAYTRIGFASFKQCVAVFTTQGHTLTKIAEELGLVPPRFWAYYSVWCRENAEPLRLGPDGESK